MHKYSLIQALREAGHEAVQLADDAGGSLLVLPYGARVLGLFPRDKPNLLWVHPALGEGISAIEFFRAPGWGNTGGDRTWISPEREIHLPNLEDPWNSYRVTPSIDPGDFTTVANKNEVSLTTHGSVRHHRLGRDCAVCLEKTIRLVPNPLRYEAGAGDLFGDVSYAGFEQTTCLSYADPDSDFQPALSIWDAVNLPAEGKIVVPTVSAVTPKDIFEPTGESHLQISPWGVSFLFDGRERHKIAVRAMDLLGGRAGYFRRIADDDYTLVVRNFFVEPSAEYVDTPWTDPTDKGYALECYNDGGANGAYGELEYHSPAMGAETGRTRCSDRAQLWGFHGSRENILAITCRLLGQAITEQFLAAMP